eukprot:TRINITY_DN8354_c0_g1_i2.p1 TRINITY_DN8354_c0_g1~~TRINITY_DN8354_c0_g1_i2.p1  ORF type:complete len:780 (-),score=126.87 TRINITY_DN8354_c0_g1_i2:81-2165(-)
MARWFVAFIIGVITALIAFGVDITTKYLIQLKFYVTDLLKDKCNDCFWAPFLGYLGLCGVFVCLAAVLVCFIEPVAGGSGISEIKCYLNGVKIPRILRFKTLLVKSIGVTLSVSGGLAAGKEGPMIHTGSIIAAGVSQGKSTSFPITTNFLKSFRNDREKRDFVSGGAAAGVAAAFGAPVGGVLFSLEEGASFWNQSLTWRSLFCSMITAFTLIFFLSGFRTGRWDTLSGGALINFGEFHTQKNHGYTILQLPLFAILGAIGGLLGAMFITVNHKLTLFRRKYINTPPRRCLEATVVGLVTALSSFLLSYYVHQCRYVNRNSNELGQTYQFYCEKGYYNDMATIFFTGQEEAVKNLFHIDGEFSHSTLVVFIIVFYILAIWTYGIGVVSGLFVPSLLTGAAIGRLMGLILLDVCAHFNWPTDINPSTFALIGAASFLGGIARMTISLTVILIECTDDITYALPIMLCLIVAKWVGDLFNEGIYDTHIHIKHTPFLEPEPPISMRKYRAHNVMSRPVVSFEQIVKVEQVYQTLCDTSHNGFPIVLTDGTFTGLILRDQLITLLKERVFIEKGQQASRLLTLEHFKSEYPRAPNLDDVILNNYERNLFIDLQPYMNQTPYLIQHNSPLSRVYRLFRTMGLRHLVVVNPRNKVVGIITRWDLCNLEYTMTKRRRVNGNEQFVDLDSSLDDVSLTTIN